MGSMSPELVASMLRSFLITGMDMQAQREEELAKRMAQPPVWRWSPGTFVFPEGLCCYCGGVMRSPCIWRAVDLQFYGSWKVVDDGGGLGHLEYDDSHPHVNTGSICMGGSRSASSVGDALFLAFNPLSTYFGGVPNPAGGLLVNTNQRIKAWFADRFNHTCGIKLEVTAVAGVDNSHRIAAVAGCTCPHCRGHRHEVQCALCSEWHVRDMPHGQHRCHRCSTRSCFKHEHQVQECVNCHAEFDLWDVNTGQLFEKPGITPCDKCKKMVCRRCMSPNAGSHQHPCVRPATVEDEDAGECDHHCDLCCGENGCVPCSACSCYPSDCNCDDEEPSTDELYDELSDDEEF